MTSTAPYTPAADRYHAGSRSGADFYRRLGSSGLAVPPLSLGFWHNFGDTKDLDSQRAAVRRRLPTTGSQLFRMAMLWSSHSRSG